MIQRILVAIDETGLSRKGVKAAIDLASATGAALVALHVVPRYPLGFFEGGVAREADDIARIERQWAEQGRSVVDRVAREAEDAGVPVRAAVAQSDSVSEAILSAVRKHKCDLVVMASHGRRGLQRMLLGSQTQEVLAHTSTPVLVIR